MKIDSGLRQASLPADRILSPDTDDRFRIEAQNSLLALDTYRFVPIPIEEEVLEEIADKALCDASNIPLV